VTDGGYVKRPFARRVAAAGSDPTAASATRPPPSSHSRLPHGNLNRYPIQTLIAPGTTIGGMSRERRPSHSDRCKALRHECPQTEFTRRQPD
jgi:hypothetical protein